MGWRNRMDLAHHYVDPVFQQKFAMLYSLRNFFASSIYAREYQFSERLCQSIVLNETFLKLLQSHQNLEKVLGEFSAAEVDFKVGAFIYFYYNDLLIDMDKTDFEGITKVLDDEISAEKIRFPWVYDKLLYDRFFDLFPGSTEKLDADETEMLIQGTQQGVFQLQNKIVGPFGVLESYENRFLPPQLSAPLWHCSDPSCSGLHVVRLTTRTTKARAVYSFLNRTLPSIYECQRSEWNKFYLDCVVSSNHYDDWKPDELPWVVASCFSHRELQTLLARLLVQESGNIRTRLPKRKRIRNIFNDAPERIVSKLSTAECFQIILICPNTVVVENTELLIEEGAINIPKTEVRLPKRAAISRGWFQINWECSNFGFRSVSKKSPIAQSRLSRLIKELYSNELGQLEWDLRDIPGETAFERLDSYLQTENPKEIIKKFVLSSPTRLRRVFQSIKYGAFKLPTSRLEEEFLINKLLWKLGFTINLYPSYSEDFWRRFQAFKSTVSSNKVYSDSDIEATRSAGSNFFVSLEEILDLSLSFITWALLSDHHRETKFICNFDSARVFMSKRLNEVNYKLGESKLDLQYSEDGKNTLYPLLAGFSQLAQECNRLVSQIDEFKRSAAEFPGFVGETDLHIFPFLHKPLILDVSPVDQTKLIDLLRKVTLELERSNISNIRNRMQHNRRASEFPNQSETETSLDVVGEVVTKMELSGICPLVYHFQGRYVDKFFRETVKTCDYRGREATFTKPSPFETTGLPSTSQPLIVIPALHIRNSSELVRFRYEESSDYVDLWRGYPLRRLRHNDLTQEQENQEISDKPEN